MKRSKISAVIAAAVMSTGLLSASAASATESMPEQVGPTVNIERGLHCTFGLRERAVVTFTDGAGEESQWVSAYNPSMRNLTTEERQSLGCTTDEYVRLGSAERLYEDLARTVGYMNDFIDERDALRVSLKNKQTEVDTARERAGRRGDRIENLRTLLRIQNRKIERQDETIRHLRSN